MCLVEEFFQLILQNGPRLGHEQIFNLARVWLTIGVDDEGEICFGLERGCVRPKLGIRVGDRLGETDIRVVVGVSKNIDSIFREHPLALPVVAESKSVEKGCRSQPLRFVRGLSHRARGRGVDRRPQSSFNCSADLVRPESVLAQPRVKRV